MAAAMAIAIATLMAAAVTTSMAAAVATAMGSAMFSPIHVSDVIIIIIIIIIILMTIKARKPISHNIIVQIFIVMKQYFCDVQKHMTHIC